MRAILTFHSIDDSGSPISVGPSTFRRQMEWLAATPVDVVPLAEIAARDDADDVIAITFDDAFVNFDTAAWPVLRDHALPATLFVVTDRAGGRNDWTAPGIPPVPSLPLLEWDGLGRLAEEGVSIASHSCTHPDLTALGPSELDAELDRSAETLETRIGRRPEAFAYPYGRTSPEVLARTRARYSLACTTELRLLRPGDATYALPRVDMYYYRQPGHFERFATPAFARRLKARAFVRSWGTRLRGLRPGRATS